MRDIETYEDIGQKKKIKTSDHSMEPVEALAHTLDIMDFNAILNSKNQQTQSKPDSIDWIELKFKR